MKRLMYLVGVLAALISLPVLLACAPAPAPAPAPTPAPTPTEPVLPEVPITYPGDTDETIIRRAQWIEGAKKEGELGGLSTPWL